jgi:hypothetical protein
MQHMARKGWVDLDAFIEVYLVACVTFDVKIPGIAVNIRRARAAAARDREFSAVWKELFPPRGALDVLDAIEFLARGEAVDAEIVRRRQAVLRRHVGCDSRGSDGKDA